MEHLGLLVFCASSLLVFGCPERERLTRDLTQGYLTSVEPDPAPFKVGLALICARYNKATHELTTNAWERMSWTDKRLSWNPSEYAGIKMVRLPSKLVWIPDLKLYNSLTPVEERDYTHVVASSDGTVIWIPTVEYKTLCTHDENGSGLQCSFKLGPWTYDADILKLELFGADVDLESYQNSTCPLAVESATLTVQTKQYPCCKELYSNILVDVNFKPHRV